MRNRCQNYIPISPDFLYFCRMQKADLNFSRQENVYFINQPVQLSFWLFFAELLCRAAKSTGTWKVGSQKFFGTGRNFLDKFRRKLNLASLSFRNVNAKYFHAKIWLITYFQAVGCPQFQKFPLLQQSGCLTKVISRGIFVTNSAFTLKKISQIFRFQERNIFFCSSASLYMKIFEYIDVLC